MLGRKNTIHSSSSSFDEESGGGAPSPDKKRRKRNSEENKSDSFEEYVMSLDSDYLDCSAEVQLKIEEKFKHWTNHSRVFSFCIEHGRIQFMAYLVNKLLEEDNIVEVDAKSFLEKTRWSYWSEEIDKKNNQLKSWPIESDSLLENPCIVDFFDDDDDDDSDDIETDDHDDDDDDDDDDKKDILPPKMPNVLLINPDGEETDVQFYKYFKFVTLKNINMESIVDDTKNSQDLGGQSQQILKLLDYNYWSSFLISTRYKIPLKYKVISLDNKKLDYPIYLIYGTDFQGPRGTYNPMRNYFGDEFFSDDSYDICKNLIGNILIMRQDGDNHDTKKLNKVVGALRPSIEWYLNQVKYLSGGKLAEPYLK